MTLHDFYSISESNCATCHVHSSSCEWQWGNPCDLCQEMPITNPRGLSCADCIESGITC